MLQNNLVSQQGAMSPRHQFFVKGRTSLFHTIQRFGEICIIANRFTIMYKMQNQKMHFIWLDFDDNQASKCFRLLNPETKQIVITKDVTFLPTEMIDTIKKR